MAKKKILSIDDEPEIVDYLVNIFSDAGYATCVAYDGREALDVVRQERPDLITLDLDMSKEWGTRFYRNLRKDPEFKEVPVIVISGLSSNKYAVKDAVANIDKPFKPDQILSLVQETIGSPD